MARNRSFQIVGGQCELESLFVAGFIPYCGSAPVPGALHWNLDPILIAALAILASRSFELCPLAWRSQEGRRRLRIRLARSLARVHFPALQPERRAVFGSRHPAYGDRIASRADDRARTGSCALVRAAWLPNMFAWGATFVFAAIFWVWHSPAFYDETLRNNVVYWLMHVTTVAAALALWTAVFASSAAVAFLLLFATGLQMSLLGALLTFAGAPLFSVHQFTTAAWGLTWLQDQQLGGLVMWVPAGLLLTGYSALALGAALRLDSPIASAAEEKVA